MAERKTEVQAKNPKSEEAQASDQLARFLRSRDHSRYELKQKLLRSFPEPLVESVLDAAVVRGWLSSDDKVAARAALLYERQNKSRAYIEAQLAKRGLPVPPVDGEAEVAKIRALVTRKFGDNWTEDESGRVLRFLKYRGFDDHWIRQVFNNEES